MVYVFFFSEYINFEIYFFNAKPSCCSETKQGHSFPGLGWLGPGFTDGIIALLAGVTQK